MVVRVLYQTLTRQARREVVHERVSSARVSQKPRAILNLVGILVVRVLQERGKLPLDALPYRVGIDEPIQMQDGYEDAHHEDVGEGPLPERAQGSQEGRTERSGLVGVAVGAHHAASGFGRAVLSGTRTTCSAALFAVVVAVVVIPPQPQSVREGKEPANVYQKQLQVRPDPREHDEQRRRDLANGLCVPQPLALPKLANCIHVRKSFHHVALHLAEFVVVRNVERVGGRLGLERAGRSGHGDVCGVGQVPHGVRLAVIEEDVVRYDEGREEELE
mmetsp:Transcript_20752/g.49874  ORF Transcript_20752/g.49874 Transcript_20752/m.49874 type:complete len:275 (-) Transcript_20752:624-1448(-)